jgi:hypothetical protein
MQKHKMSSTYQVFKEYGENIQVRHPWEKNNTINFLTFITDRKVIGKKIHLKHIILFLKTSITYSNPLHI